MAAMSGSKGSRPPRKAIFSFDSSGWMYIYHLGAARYLQKQILPRMQEDSVAFSGSSGGALVACLLASFSLILAGGALGTVDGAL